MRKDIQDTLSIPDTVQITVEEGLITVKCKDAEVKRRLHPLINLKIEDNHIVLRSKSASKRENKYLKTTKAHLKNMMQGAQKPFIYTLKVCSGHFPITVTAQDGKLEVKNLFGEKVPRVLKIKEGVNVKVEGDLITAVSPDKEKVAQVAAEIEALTKRSGFDARVFQDGCYIIQKGEKIIK